MIIYIPMYEKFLTKHDKNKNKKNLKKNFRSGDWPACVVLRRGYGGTFFSSLLVANATLICYVNNIFCTYIDKIC